MEDGSKPARAGVIRALRFCIIESSVATREIRRKSTLESIGLAGVVHGGQIKGFIFTAKRCLVEAKLRGKNRFVRRL